MDASSPETPRGSTIAARIRSGAQAALVLAGAIAAWIFVPPEVLLPGAAVVLAVAIGGVFALGTWMRRLDPAESGERRALLTEAGVTLAMAGLAAFIVLLLEYAD